MVALKESPTRFGREEDENVVMYLLSVARITENPLQIPRKP
jgi:hypothetical protein